MLLNKSILLVISFNWDEMKYNFFTFIAIFIYLDPMISANSIDEVIAHLETIIAECRQRQSRLGYFACLYRKMTIAVKNGIANNIFADGKRMELLDVIFANRYLQAYEAFTSNAACTQSWHSVFLSASSDNLIVLQHLILGINTHINLDLGIAAAETMEGQNIMDLEIDFNKINTIIGALMQNVQDDLSEIWPPLKLITTMANHQQDVVLNFSISAARKASWANALALSGLSGNGKNNYIGIIDGTVEQLCKRIVNPGFAMRLLLRPVLKMESARVSDNIERLYN